MRIPWRQTGGGTDISIPWCGLLVADSISLGRSTARGVLAAMAGGYCEEEGAGSEYDDR